MRMLVRRPHTSRGGAKQVGVVSSGRFRRGVVQVLRSTVSLLAAVFLPVAGLFWWLAVGADTVWIIATGLAAAPARTQYDAVVLAGIAVFGLWVLVAFLRWCRPEISANAPISVARAGGPLDRDMSPANRRKWHQVQHEYGAKVANAALAAADADEDVLEVARRVAVAVPGSLPVWVVNASWHEAAHAVVAHRMGCPVIEVSVDRRTGNGHVHAEEPPSPSSAAERLWANLVHTVAGQVIDSRRGVPDAGSVRDMLAAGDLAAALIATGQTPPGYDGPLGVDEVLGRARVEASRLLDENERAVAAVARVLADEPDGAVIWSTRFRRLIDGDRAAASRVDETPNLRGHELSAQVRGAL